jgi:hypothetical protein
VLWWKTLAKVEFAGASRVQELSRASGRAGSWAKYLTALLADGPRAYADNADVEIEALLVDGTLLPLVLSRGGEGTAEPCSPYSHYVAYSLEEAASMAVFGSGYDCETTYPRSPN